MNLLYNIVNRKDGYMIVKEVVLMQIKFIPGTLLPYHKEIGPNTFSVIATLCTAAGGLSLSQIVSITGLEASTIQNWIKRGWVAKPTGKKYSQRQIARILIISVLRDCIQLDKIAHLMRYVNGSVDDVSDDIIDEGELFNRLCGVLFELDENRLSLKDIRAAIANQLADYEGPRLDSAECLSRALEIMVTAYLSARMKQLAEQLYSELPDLGTISF